MIHHGAAELLAVVLVGLLQVLHARREHLHLRHRSAGRLGQRIEHELEQEGDDDDRPAPVADDVVRLLQHPEERLGQQRQHAVVGDEVEPGACGLQLRLQLGAEEKRFLERRAALRRHGHGRSGRREQILVAGGLQRIGVALALGRHHCR
jgi:hypothetical protein